MPTPNTVHPSIQALNDYYQSLRPWHLGWWFFPKSIATALNTPSNPESRVRAATSIFEIFLSARGFFSRIYTFFFGKCFNANLLLATHVLKQANLLSTENFEAVSKHQYTWLVALALKILHESGLLSGDNAQLNRDTIVQHQDPWSVAEVLKTLHKAGLLSGENAQANFLAVVQHQDPGSVARALKTLHKAGLLSGENSQANFLAAMQHQNPYTVARALKTLHKAGLLSGENAQANFLAVVQHKDHCSVSDALKTLHETGLLSGENSQANFLAVVQHQNPFSVACALTILHTAGLLTTEKKQARFNTLTQYPHVSQLNWLLFYLNRARLLTEASYQLVLQHADILCAGAVEWRNVPEDFFFTHPERFQHILTLCTHEQQTVLERQALVARYVQQQLGFDAPAGAALAINPAQSTQTASVHVSTNATLLTVQTPPASANSSAFFQTETKPGMTGDSCGSGSTPAP